jgi:hypothetical protein
LRAVTAETESHRKPSEDLSIELEEFTEAAPPRPQFEESQPPNIAKLDTIKRPRIVVPISAEVRQQMELEARQERKAQKASVSGRKAPVGGPAVSSRPATRGRRALVALGLIMAFSGMLLATHKYVTSHWNPLTSVANLGETFAIGKEGVTTTDVNLRPVANTANAPIGVAEIGSRVKILSVAENNWVEVQVVAHGRPKTDPYSSDRGWINKRYVRFD